MKKKWIWPAVVGLTVTAYTVYMLLDTFVITRVYTVVEQTASAGEEQAEDDSEEDADAADDSSDSSGSAETSGEDSDSGSTAGSSKSRTDKGGGSGAGGKGPGSSDSGGKGPGSGSGSRSGSGRSSGSSGEEDSDSSDSGTAASSADDTIGLLGTYSDDDISITITSYREDDTTIYVADIKLSSSDYLQTAFAQSAYGRNVTDKTSNIAEEVGAILAVNGDYYGAQESGYVIRGGVLYRSDAVSNADEQEDLVIWSDGSFSIIAESDITAQELLGEGAQEVFSFGPALVENGETTVSESDEVAKAQTDNPRTAIGVLDDLHYVFVVSDGRTDESEGLTLYELAGFMESLGAVCAYNLDGGGSSTMVFQGELINNPTTNGNRISERSVSDIIYIGY